MVRAQTGDSLDAFIPQRTAVRYIGIEAPPDNTACGRQATQRHAQLIAGGVFLEAESGFEFDAGGLRLFHAFNTNGEDVAQLLVREGLARATAEPHRYRQQYLQAEAQARAANRGCVWAMP